MHPLPSKSFANASEYFTDIVTQQLCHLRYQLYNTLLEKNEWKEKYIAQCMLQRIARSLKPESSPIRLYCDDFLLPSV
ncbi:hypothetical protein APSETT445_006545 [Aspergillus pseudonomiae]